MFCCWTAWLNAPIKSFLIFPTSPISGREKAQMHKCAAQLSHQTNWVESKHGLQYTVLVQWPVGFSFNIYLIVCLFLILPFPLLPIPSPTFPLTTQLQLLLFFSSEKGRPPIDTNQLWYIQLAVRRGTFSPTKAIWGSPVGGNSPRSR